MAIAPFIPRRALFSNPDHASPQVSKNGLFLAYLAPWEGVLNIWVRDLKTGQGRVLTKDKGRGIRSYGWAFTNGHIIYCQDRQGDENWQIFVLDFETENIRCLTPEQGIHGQIVASSLHYPHEIIIGLNNRDPQLHDYYRVNILTGERSLVLENPGFAGVEFDNHLNLRFGAEVRPDGGLKTLIYGNNEWKSFWEIGPEDALTTSMVGFSQNNDKIYLLDSRGSDTSVLKCVTIETKEEEILAHETQADISDFLVDPIDKTPQAYGVNYLHKRWHFFHKAIEKDVEFLKTFSKGDVEIVSRSLDDQVWVVGFVKDYEPLSFYLFNRANRHVDFLFSSRASLEGYTFHPMEAVPIKARDGLDLVCYITKPPMTEGKPIPFVLNIHGGPRTRDVWGFDTIHQWLSNRGYGVISINYRGSMGFGKNFMNKGNGEWAAAMHTDIIDVAEWAIGQGFADRDKIAIMGGSYGGYATLVGLTLTPDYFACGVDLVGPSNLETLVESIPPYWKPVRDVMKVMLGADFETEEGRAFLRERSPLTHSHRVSKPLLIAQGANDPRVRQAESDQIVKALQEKNIPVIYMLYPDEGHGFVCPENRLSFYGVTEAFLARVLKGSCESLNDNFEGSSLQIVAGKDYIEDLAGYENKED